MSTIRSTVAILVFAAPIVSPVFGDDEWIGRKFMPKERCVIKIGNRETPTKGVPLPYIGRQVSGEWLWIGEGWVQKSRVVPFDEAAGYYTDYLQKHPNSAWAFNLRGWMRFESGDYDNAAKDYTAAIRLDPRDPMTYNNRGGCRQKMGDYANALKDFNETVRLSPAESWGYNALAWLLATSPEARYRDGKKAVAMATKASTIAGWKDPYLLDTLAAAYAEAGDFDAAVRWQTKAIDMLSGDKLAAAAGRERLSLYSDKQPYREQPATSHSSASRTTRR